MEYKPGYLLKITTWENDYDNIRVTEYSGLNKSHVLFLIRVAQLFNSNGRRGDNSGYGNETITKELSDMINRDIDSIAMEYNDIPEDWSKSAYKLQNPEEEIDDDFYGDCIYDMIGIWCEGERWRVFDEFEVFLIPDVNIKNVTESFT